MVNGIARGMTLSKATGPSWLLVALFNLGHEPEVVATEQRPMNFVPASKHFKRRGSLRELDAAIQRLKQDPQPFEVVLDDRRVAARPLTVEGRLHGLWYWSSRADVEMHEPPPAGAWVIDLTTYTALGSAEWAEMADIPNEVRGQERHVAAMFAQVDTSTGKEAHALSLIEAKPIGAPFQAEWIVRRTDESRWRSLFHLRIQGVERNGGVHRVALGLSQNIGELDRMSRRRTLEDVMHVGLRAAREPGEYVALMSAKKLALIRWLTDPSPEIAWLGVAHEATPAIHPDDIDEARRILHVGTSDWGSLSEGTVRVMGVDNRWVHVRARAERVEVENGEEAVAVRVFVPVTSLPGEIT